MVSAADAEETQSWMEGAGRRVLSAAAETLDRYIRGIRESRRFAGFRTRDDATIAGHAPSLIAELAQSLRLRGSANGDVSAELRATSAMQRAIAERHGAQRARLGWPEEGIRTEMDILRVAVTSTLEPRSASETPLASPAILAVLSATLDQLWRSAVIGYRTANSPGSRPSEEASGLYG